MEKTTHLTWQVSRWFNAGKAPSPQQLRGKVVVVHAFQMLCPGCVLHGTPQARRIHKTFSGQDVAVIGLHTVFENHEVMTPEALAVFISEFSLDFPIAVDAPAPGQSIPKTMTIYGLHGTPSLLLFDCEGRLAWHHFGQVEDMVVGAQIGDLLGGKVG
ncbi:MAG: peroxiredoxin family protein [Hyphomicrobiales bacterium]